MRIGTFTIVTLFTDESVFISFVFFIWIQESFKILLYKFWLIISILSLANLTLVAADYL